MASIFEKINTLISANMHSLVDRALEAVISDLRRMQSA